MLKSGSVFLLGFPIFRHHFFKPYKWLKLKQGPSEIRAVKMCLTWGQTQEFREEKVRVT